MRISDLTDSAAAHVCVVRLEEQDRGRSDKEEKARAEASSSRADDVLLRCRNKHNHLSYERLREELRLPYSVLKFERSQVRLWRAVQGEVEQ